MPISITATEGVMSEENLALVGKKVTEALLKHHGLQENTVMRPNVTCQIHVLPKNLSLSGGEPFQGVWVETKTPSFALADRKIQEDFFGEVTDIVYDLAGGAVPRNFIFTNATHAVDGSWNMDGKALSNEQISDRLSQG